MVLIVSVNQNNKKIIIKDMKNRIKIGLKGNEINERMKTLMGFQL
jgi:hypothetical protein